MRKGGLENLILAGHIEGKRDRLESVIIFMTVLYKGTVEQRLGVRVKRKNITKGYKGWEMWRTIDRPCSKGSRRIGLIHLNFVTYIQHPNSVDS